MLEDILTSNNVVESINDNLDELIKLIPELRFMIYFEHKNPHHHLDVWEHTLYALSLSQNDFEIRLSLLLHDVGKPFCYQEGEIRHYHGHALESAIMTNDILNRLGYDKKFNDRICYLVENHDTPISEEDLIEDYDLNIKRYKIQVCDSLAHNPNEIIRRVKYLDKVKKIIKENR